LAQPCPFCRLAKAPAAHEIYRDGDFIVVLDRESLGLGHCMVIPRRHLAKVYELNAEDLANLIALAARLAKNLEAALKVKAVGLMAFGSGLPHAHLHLVPHNDSRVLIRPEEYVRKLSDTQLGAEAKRLRRLLNGKRRRHRMRHKPSH
jgi:diadenosine tetraphosphate (Ap4A) HIT family hydrolase